MPIPSISEQKQGFHSIPLVLEETWDETERRWFASLPPGHPTWPIFIQ